MYAISQAYPGAEVTLLSSPGKRGAPGARELLDEASWLADVMIYYGEDLANRERRRELFSRLRARHFDLWFELPASLARLRELVRNMVVARIAGAGWGYGWRLATIRIAAQAQSEHFGFPTEVERLASIVADSGITVRNLSFPLPIGELHRERVDCLLHGTHKPIVAIAPGAKRPANRWPLDRFAKVVRHLKANFVVVVLGGTAEQKLCSELVGAVGGETLNLAGQMSLLESAELLRRCRLAICNDSGTQHLAAAVGTPCISIFSRRDFKGKWWPYGAQNVVLHKEVECHTCFLDICPFDNRCIKMIDVGEVIEAVDQLVKKSSVRSFLAGSNQAA
jgi:ADP-heptose:LPS heptosyltransferase